MSPTGGIRQEKEIKNLIVVDAVFCTGVTTEILNGWDHHGKGSREE
jgi:hypothetical protein